jgi:uncharacterized protein
MIRPYELSVGLKVRLDGDVLGTSDELWAILMASRDGDLETVERLVDANPPLIFGKYNYTPPIHFAVREGRAEVVRYLLDAGAHDVEYRTYPFLETLQTVAEDRGYEEIVSMLNEYEAHPERHRYSRDTWGIEYGHDAETVEFQRSIASHQHNHVASMLDRRPELVQDQLLFWGEGVLCRSANDPDPEMLELLISRGATVPPTSKWGRAYYFKHYHIAKYLIEHGMDARHSTWHHVTLLHDAAWDGEVDKAELLLDNGADIDAIEEEYQSTPLGLAARWGHEEMVDLLLARGGDPNKAGAKWARPLWWARCKGHVYLERPIVDAGAYY